MNETIETIPAPGEADKPAVYTENPSVVLCVRAWAAAYKESRASNKSDYEASKDATLAYRNTMPSLSGYENIRNFIACVSRGILLGVIDGKIGAKLLYAAQTALSAASRKPIAAKAV
jgi:hypothetical protein